MGSNSRDEVWERNCADLETYVQEYGSIAVPADYVSPNDIKIRFWLNNQKSKQDNLTKSQKQRLERLGVSFKSQSELAWETALNHATQYYTAHGNLDVPSKYVIEDGFNLYYWVNDMRKKHNAGKLNSHQIQQLDAITFPWTTPSEQSWSEYYHALKQFITTIRTCSVPVTYRTEDGLWLGRWVPKQQEKIVTLPEQKRLALKNAGFV